MPRTLLPAALLLLAGLLPGCGGDPWTQLDERLTEVEVQAGMADRDTTRQIHSKEARKRKVKAEQGRLAFYRDPEVAALIESGRKGPPGDPITEKANRYWQRSLTARAWTPEEKAEETRLVGALDEAASLEATWYSPDGTLKVDLGGSWDEASRGADKLDEATRAGLAEAWVEHHLRPIGADLVALVELRNTVAKREGFPTYWELSLAAQGLTPEGVDGIVAELTRAIRPALDATQQAVAAQAQASGLADSFVNRPLLRRRAGLNAGRDEAEVYTDADTAEEVIRAAIGDLGIATEGWQVYTGPRRYVRAGVYGFVIRPPEHVAIVMSQDERWSFWPFEALGHESGHAVWWRGLPPEAVASPVDWQPAEPWFEGFAQFFERLVFEPAFVARYLPAVPAAEREGLAAWRARHVAEAIADSIVSVQVERRLYANPKDLGALTREASTIRAALTGEPVGPATAGGLTWEPSLVSSLLWSYPAYDQNYLYAYLTEAWMHEAVRALVGDPVNNPKVGPLLVDRVIRAPLRTPFPDRIAALGPVDRAAALGRYLETGRLPPPAAGTAALGGGPPGGAAPGTDPSPASPVSPPASTP